MRDSYSYLKALRHPDVLVGIKEGIPTRLPHVEIILADLCQQHCSFCAYRLEGYTSNQMFDEKRMMPEAKAFEILVVGPFEFMVADRQISYSSRYKSGGFRWIGYGRTCFLHWHGRLSWC